MSNKKHIDRVFQESFKDFEAQPNPDLWSKIENNLAPEAIKPKPMFPIGIRIASLAAVLALLISIGYIVLSENSAKQEPSKQKIVNTPLETPKVDSKTNTPTTNTNSEKVASQNLESATTENESTDVVNTTSINEVVATANSGNQSNTSIKNNSTHVSSNNSVVSESEVIKEHQNNSVANKNTLSNNAHVNTPNNYIASQNNTSNITNGAAGVASKKSYKTNNTTNTEATQTNANATNNTINTTALALTSNATGGSNKAPTQTNKTNTGTETDYSKSERSLEESVAWNAKSGNTSLNEKEKEETLIVGDLLSSKSPSIEDAIAADLKKLQTKTETKLTNRWQVQANIAPVYYNSLGQGSHIDEEFVANSKSGETNTSYGIHVSYAISKKFAIRSGLNTLNLSYDTDNVILYESPTSNNQGGTNPLKNIDLAPGSQSLTAFSGDNLGFQQINNELYNAAISQRLSYYEIPLELEYKLVDNRFGLNIIGGMSSFILNDNEVYSEFEEFRTYIGEANNINSLSFSTNFGLGLLYNFSDKLLFNFEPTFKYQLNGYENTAGNFKPYIIGVYTGFSYKF
ncbi:hypothetical protein ACW5R3_02000 [Bizionia sp. KMM 8389]